MNAEKRKIMHSALDYFFWYASLAMSVLVLIVYVWMYAFSLAEKFFEVYTFLYYVCVVLYAVERKVKTQLYPETTEKRFGELFVIGWIATAIVFATITLFWQHDKLAQFTDLVVMVAFVCGIFGFGQAIKLVKLPLISPDKKE